MRILGLAFITAMLLIVATSLCAEESATTDSKSNLIETQETTPQAACDLSPIKEQISQQSREFSQEMRQIKREIALLRQSIEKPGIKEIFAGIGYILGLFGVAFYFSTRRKRRSNAEEG